MSQTTISSNILRCSRTRARCSEALYVLSTAEIFVGMVVRVLDVLEVVCFMCFGCCRRRCRVRGGCE